MNLYGIRIKCGLPSEGWFFPPAYFSNWILTLSIFQYVCFVFCRTHQDWEYRSYGNNSCRILWFIGESSKLPAQICSRIHVLRRLWRAEPTSRLPLLHWLLFKWKWWSKMFAQRLRFGNQVWKTDFDFFFANNRAQTAKRRCYWPRITTLGTWYSWFYKLSFYFHFVSK